MMHLKIINIPITNILLIYYNEKRPKHKIDLAVHYLQVIYIKEAAVNCVLRKLI